MGWGDQLISAILIISFEGHNPHIKQKYTLIWLIPVISMYCWQNGLQSSFVKTIFAIGFIILWHYILKLCLFNNIEVILKFVLNH